jgi:DNA-binding NarL/FixJ family response regulator
MEAAVTTTHRNGKAEHQFKLTPREVTILEWISKGKQYKEIASLMDSTVNAINQQAFTILNKLGAHTNAGAVGLALRRGIIN